MYGTLNAYLQKLDHVVANGAPSNAVDAFMEGYCTAPLEELASIRRAVEPWVALLPTLAHLAAGYQPDMFHELAMHCVKNYRVTSQATTLPVVDAMQAMQTVFEAQEPFTQNWNALQELLQAQIGEDPYVTGDFTCD